MSSFDFKFPVNTDDLLIDHADNYCVRHVHSVPELSRALKDAQISFRDLGPIYILQHFDTFFSVLQHSQTLPRNVVYGAFEDVMKSLAVLPDTINYYLEDEENITEHVQLEVRNMIQMSMFLYVNLFSTLEKPQDSDISLSALKKGKKPRKNLQTASSLHVNWSKVIFVVKFIFQSELNKFWPNTGVEDALINKLLELTMLMLEDDKIKLDKETQCEIFSLFGILLSNYDYIEPLVARLTRLVKENEYLVSIIADGINDLVNELKSNALLLKFVMELTEWQMHEVNSDSNATKNCVKLVIEFSTRMPGYMQEILTSSLLKFLRVDSYQLRIMVLGVGVKVLEAGTEKAGSLKEEEKETWLLFRNDILSLLLRFLNDSSGFVRARVFQDISHLMQENCIPPSMIQPYLTKAVLHLNDVVGPARKAAATCVTSNLKYNTFGHKLPLSKFQAEYNEKRNECMELKYEIYGLDMERQEPLENEWQQHAEALKTLLDKVDLEKETTMNEDKENDENEDSDENEDEGQENNVNAGNTTTNGTHQPQSIESLVRGAIMEKNYKAAVNYCRKLKDSVLYQKLKQKYDSMSQVEYLLCFMHILYVNVNLADVRYPSETQLETLSKCEKSVEYLGKLVAFLNSMKDAMAVMCTMLNSTQIGDMREAVDFIVTAKQFDLDGSAEGINALLKIMLRNEEDRKTVACEALKTIYLTSDSTYLLGHTTHVCENLIDLCSNVSSSSIEALVSLMSFWARKGIISNDIIDALWNYFLQKNNLGNPTKARYALCVLRLTALGRPTVIERNYKIVSRVCLVERGQTDPLLVVEGLDMLLLLSNNASNATGEEVAFKITASDPIWTELLNILKFYRNHKSPVVNNILTSALRLVFALNTRPFKCVALVLEMYTPRDQESAIPHDDGNDNIDKVVQKTNTISLRQMIRYFVCVGEVSMCMLKYLDTDVYKEMKRRQNMKPTGAKLNSTKTLITPNMKASNKRKENLDASVVSSVGGEMLDDSIMDGADALDEDADQISRILDHALDSDQDLGKMYKNVVEVCRKSKLPEYNHEQLQIAACQALARGMLLSSVFCEFHVHLMFTLLLRTNFVKVKTCLLVHLVDLYERSPNIVDPYTSKLYALLEDDDSEVRQFTLNILSLLILKDMIRPQGDIWRLAVCLVDEDSTMRSSARSFFLQSTEKSSDLYNYMPDIFSSLTLKYPRTESPPDKNEEKFCEILQFLFPLITKSKQIESLVERFCLKFDNADDTIAKRIAFTLSLMPYTDRCLQKLIENFPKYKHYILVDEVYMWLKIIYTKAGKNKALKPIVEELDALFQEMFKVDGKTPREVFKKPVAPLKKGKKEKVTKTAKAKPRRRRISSSSD